VGTGEAMGGSIELPGGRAIQLRARGAPSDLPLLSPIEIRAFVGSSHQNQSPNKHNISWALTKDSGTCTLKTVL
jgi:hypothetical protein